MGERMRSQLRARNKTAHRGAIGSQSRRLPVAGNNGLSPFPSPLSLALVPLSFCCRCFRCPVVTTGRRARQATRRGDVVAFAASAARRRNRAAKGLRWRSRVRGRRAGRRAEGGQGRDVGCALPLALLQVESVQLCPCVVPREGRISLAVGIWQRQRKQGWGEVCVRAARDGGSSCSPVLVRTNRPLRSPCFIPVGFFPAALLLALLAPRPPTMAALMLLGCILIGYALPTALFFVLFLRKAQLVIVMLARSVAPLPRCTLR